MELTRERGGGYVVALERGEHRFEIDELGPDTIRVRSNGLSSTARFFRERDRLYVLQRGVTLDVRDLTLAAPAAPQTADSDGKVRAAMNGRVVAVLVKAGERGLACGEVQDALGIPKSTLAHHLGQLVAAGLVTQTREGRVQRCRINPDRARAHPRPADRAPIWRPTGPLSAHEQPTLSPPSMRGQRTRVL